MALPDRDVLGSRPPGQGVRRVAPSSPAMTLISAVVIVGVLFYARDILVPLALAVMLSFALGPLVVLLRRAHLGRVPSVIAAVVLAFLIISGIGSLVGSQLASLAGNLPIYQYTVMHKVHTLQDAATNVFGRMPKVLEELGGEIAQPPKKEEPAEPAPSGEQKPQKPIPVEIHEPPPTTLGIIRTIVGPLLGPLATAGIVVIFVIFFLLQREDLRDRFIRLVGAGDLQKATIGIDDGARRVSRYLVVQLALNAGFGVVIGIGLWLIGVPNPVLWGIIAMLLRFVPYIGPPIAALFPAAMALAVDPGWSMVLWTLGLFLVVEPILGQAVEPFLYGRSTGLSAVAIVVAAAFWTWLWGPVGLLLSTPLTLCLVVIGRHVQRLEFLDIMLGDRPSLTPEENFYQRMLADDPDEAAGQAETYLADHKLADYYDEVALRGLVLAQIDANRGALDPERRAQIKDTVHEVIDDLAEHVDAEPEASEDKEEKGAAAEPAAQPAATPPEAAPVPVVPSDDAVKDAWRGRRALCIGGRGALDEAAAAMLCQLLERRGISSHVVPVEAVTAMTIARLDVEGVAAICLSYLEPGGLSNARYLVRRLRRRLPGVRILVGFWTLDEQSPKAHEAPRQTGADRIVTSLRAAVEALATMPPEPPAAGDRRAAAPSEPAPAAG